MRPYVGADGVRMSAVASNDPSRPPAAWYRDAETGLWRWWDGLAWTDGIRRDSDWRLRIMVSSRAERIDSWVRNWSLAAMAIGSAVVAYNVAAGRTISVVEVLLLPAIPALVFGQVWLIALFNARLPTRKERRQGTGRSRRAANPFRLMFGTSRRMAIATYGLFFLLWLAGMAALLSGPSGNPTKPPPGCQYALNNHGSVECVSHATYERAQLSGQQLVASVITAFFVVHFAGTAGELTRRLRQGPDPTVLPSF
jgi:hypothetical protein